MLTLVTGCDHRYFVYLKQLLNNVINVCKKPELIKEKINIVVYDLGMTEEDKKELPKEIILETFDFDKYPEHVSLKKYNGMNCSYAWKPIIIHEVCEKYKDLVHWMDTQTLYSNFNNMINVLKNDYIYTPISCADVQKWSHQSTIKYMNASNYLKCRNRSGGIFGINYNIEWCKELVTEWKDYSLIKECIIPEGSSRKNHRQDQSILTILYYKYHSIHNFKKHDNKIDLKTHNLIDNIGVLNEH